MKHYSNRSRKALVEKIKALGQTEHDELLRILKSHDVPYTQNSNGVFINISAVSDAAIGQLDDFVKFCMSNMQELDDYDKRLNECKQNATGIISSMSYAEDVLNGSDGPDAADENNINSMNNEMSNIDKQAAADCQVDDWEGFIEKYSDDVDRVRAFSRSISAYKGSFTSSVSTMAKKKVCTKFNTAKKKYAKKQTTDTSAPATTSSKGGATQQQQQLSNVLTYEAYLQDACVQDLLQQDA